MGWKLYPINEFRNHQHSWEELNEGSTGSPLLDIAFVVPLIEVFGTGKELLGCYENAGRPMAMTILTPKGTSAWETFNPSQSPIGTWLQDGIDVDLKQLLADLIGKLPGLALAVGITQQDPDNLPRPEESSTLKTLDHIRTARTVIKGSFEDYWGGRGKNLRTNMRKQRHRLEKAGVATRLDVVTSIDQVAAAVADYGRLESSGWKAKAGTAVHADNSQGVFYRRMLEGFCSKGAGRIFRYLYDDRVVASYLSIEGHDSIVILKTAYDESIGNDTSPAILMRQEVFRQLFEERRLKRIESYGKVVDWNSRWAEEARTLYHMTQYRWPALPLLQRIRKRVGSAALGLQHG